MVLLNDDALLWGSLGAVGVMSGVVLKNSMEQLGKKDKPLSTLVGPALFVLGWILFGYSVVMGDLTASPKTIQTVVAIVLIVGSVMYMKRQMAQGREIPPAIGLLFPLGWFLLAFTVGVGGYDQFSLDALMSQKAVMTFGAAVLVMASMIGALPWQRERCVVDGPGLPLFAGAWVLMVAANAL